MKINLSPDGDDLIIEAVNFKEARLLAILYQRINLLQSIAEDFSFPDTVELENAGSSLALIWKIPSKEAINEE